MYGLQVNCIANKDKGELFMAECMHPGDQVGHKHKKFRSWGRVFYLELGLGQVPNLFAYSYL